MPEVLQRNRLAVIVAAALISGVAATAIAVAFPGRAEHAPVAAADAGVVATPTPFVAPPTPSPTPMPTPTTQPVYSSSRSSSGTTRTHTAPAPAPRRAAPAPNSGDCAGMPGPACKAVSNPPDQPSRPEP